MNRIDYKKRVITPGGRVGDDRSTGSRANGENWVERRGGLPKYIRTVRNALMRAGKSEATATAIAVASIKRWARGGGNVSAKVRAAAARALAQWEAMKAGKGFGDVQYTKASLVPGLTHGDVAFLKDLGLDIGVALLAGRQVIRNTEEDGSSGLAAKSNGDDMKIEHKTVGVSGLKVLDEDDGIVETYVSVTGLVDNVKDIIEPGAYAKTLAARKPKGVWSHDWNTPVSKTLDVKELLPGDPLLPKNLPGTDDPWPAGCGALLVKTQFNLDTQRGREAYSDVVFYGDDQEWSIGYNVPAGGAIIDGKKGIRSIKTLDLYEYSPVLWGAMPNARSAGGVKSAQEAHRGYKNLFGDDYYVKLDKKSIDNFVIEMKDMLGDYEPEDAPFELDMSGIDDLSESLLEEVGNKGALSADSLNLVKKAIGALTDLLNAMQPNEETQEEKSSQFDIEEKELSDVISSVKAAGVLTPEMEEELADYAAEFDTAVQEGDQNTIEESANAILDIVDDSIDAAEGLEADGLKSIAAAIGSILTKSTTEEPEEVPEEEGVSVDDVELADNETHKIAEVETVPEEPGEKVLLDTHEVKDLRSFLDSLS